MWLKSGLGLLVAALAVAGSVAAANPPIVGKLVGAASVARPYTINVSRPGDVLVEQATVAPGGSFGWHTHRSAVAVVVTGGTLTLYDSANSKCSPQRFSKGQGFVEQAHHVHLARNEGKTPVTLYATYLGVPHGLKTDVPASKPANCPSL